MTNQISRQTEVSSHRRQISSATAYISLVVAAGVLALPMLIYGPMATGHDTLEQLNFTHHFSEQFWSWRVVASMAFGYESWPWKSHLVRVSPLFELRVLSLATVRQNPSLQPLQCGRIPGAARFRDLRVPMAANSSQPERSSRKCHPLHVDAISSCRGFLSPHRSIRVLGFRLDALNFIFCDSGLTQKTFRDCRRCICASNTEPPGQRGDIFSDSIGCNTHPFRARRENSVCPPRRRRNDARCRALELLLLAGALPCPILPRESFVRSGYILADKRSDNFRRPAPGEFDGPLHRFSFIEHAYHGCLHHFLLPRNS